MRLSGLFIVLLMVCLLLVGCSNSTEPARLNTPELLGAWLYSGYDADNQIDIYCKADSLHGDRPGYRFAENDQLFVRTSGWCGTPPLTFYNVEGSWHADTNTLLRIERDGFGELWIYTMEIISLSDEELRIKISPTE